MKPISCILTKRIFYLLLLGVPWITYGQSYNQRPDFIKANSVWAFGEGAGLNFNGGGPIAFPTKQFSDEGCASVADPETGDLLFYSNGAQCWNAKGHVMANGDSLLGNAGKWAGAIYYSTAQGVCIAPVINAPGQYYLFSLSGTTSGGPKATGSLFYSIVDRNLDSGRGNIIDGKKNITLARDSLSEGMIVIPGNNCDMWLVVHSLSLPQFKAFHITYKGIDPDPVISNTGYAMPRCTIGNLSISPDRKKIALTDWYKGTLLAHFDALTGTVSDAMLINIGADYGVSFSPDNSKLYLSQPSDIHQLDISVFDSAAIVSSKQKIGASPRKFLYSLRLYQDTIYVAVEKSNYLHRINSPNLPGVACDFEQDAITLSPGTISRFSLGNDVVFPTIPDTTFNLALDSFICAMEFTLRAPKGFTTFEWEDDSNPSSIRNITTPGVYRLFSWSYCHSRMDTFIIRGLSFPTPEVITGIRMLRTKLPYASYQWLLNGIPIPDATQRNCAVNQNGDYQVEVDNHEGCVVTSAIYEVRNITGLEQPFSKSSLVRVHPVPNRDMLYVEAQEGIRFEIRSIEGKTIKSLVGTQQVSLKEYTPGMYFLQVYDLKQNLLQTEKIILLP